EPREDVYVYRAQVPRENVRRLFLDYVRRINELKDHPAFYNTLTTNCTTNVLFHTRVNPNAPPLSWKVLLSGYTPLYAYELGRHGAERARCESARAFRREGAPGRAERRRSPAGRHRLRSVERLRRPDQDADSGQAGGRRPAFQQFPHDGALLPDAHGAPDR